MEARSDLGKAVMRTLRVGDGHVLRDDAPQHRSPTRGPGSAGTSTAVSQFRGRSMCAKTNVRAMSLTSTAARAISLARVMQFGAMPRALCRLGGRSYRRAAALWSLGLAQLRLEVRRQLCQVVRQARRTEESPSSRCGSLQPSKATCYLRPSRYQPPCKARMREHLALVFVGDGGSLRLIKCRVHSQEPATITQPWQEIVRIPLGTRRCL